jgi:hypothetical protein
LVHDFYKLNAELFKEDGNNDLIEKAVIKTIAIMGSGIRLDLRPDVTRELIRWNKALGIL